MKNKILLLIFALTLPISMLAQELNKIVFDENKNQNILIGSCDMQTLKSGEFAKSFNDEYNNYKPNQNIISELKKHSNNVSITIIFASWCSDSKEQTPRFIKILDELNFNYSNVKIIAVDSKLNAPNIIPSDYSLRRVPTFIFYRNNAEFGRIIETPDGTIEEDMLKIFSR